MVVQSEVSGRVTFAVRQAPQRIPEHGWRPKQSTRRRGAIWSDADRAVSTRAHVRSAAPCSSYDVLSAHMFVLRRCVDPGSRWGAKCEVISEGCVPPVRGGAAGPGVTELPGCCARTDESKLQLRWALCDVAASSRCHLCE